MPECDSLHLVTGERRTCPICSRGRFETSRERVRIHSNVRKWMGFSFTVWRCAECGSLHSLERVDLNLFYQDYPYGKRRLDVWTRRVFGNYLSRLKSCGLTRESSVLDYGCSKGLFLDFLRERGYNRIIGYDPYSNQYADASVMGAQYDFVLAQDVIEHVEDPVALLRALKDCTGQHGILCIGTPNADGIDLSRPEVFIHSLHQPYHIHMFSRQALLSLARQLGFAIVQVYDRHIFDTLIPFVNWAFIRALLASKDDSLDAGFDPISPFKLFSPVLVYYGIFGYFHPTRSEMMVMLRK